MAAAGEEDVLASLIHWICLRYKGSYDTQNNRGEIAISYLGIVLGRIYSGVTKV
jgi:hypothetical protein